MQKVSDEVGKTKESVEILKKCLRKVMMRKKSESNRIFEKLGRDIQRRGQKID